MIHPPQPPLLPLLLRVFSSLPVDAERKRIKENMLQPAWRWTESTHWHAHTNTHTSIDARGQHVFRVEGKHAACAICHSVNASDAADWLFFLYAFSPQGGALTHECVRLWPPSSPTTVYRQLF